MIKIIYILGFLLLIGFMSYAQGNKMIIEDLIKKDNYADHLWEERGLNPSNEIVIKQLELVTFDFLKNLQQLYHNTKLENIDQLKAIQQLVNQLPWENFDTEEREFLADVIAPAIESMGYNPWSII